MPLIAALHVLCAATMRTLHNRMKMALISVSLFCLKLLYNTLTLSKDSILLQVFFLLCSTYVWQDEDVVKF